MDWYWSAFHTSWQYELPNIMSDEIMEEDIDENFYNDNYEEDEDISPNLEENYYDTEDNWEDEDSSCADPERDIMGALRNGAGENHGF